MVSQHQCWSKPPQFWSEPGSWSDLGSWSKPGPDLVWSGVGDTCPSSTVLHQIDVDLVLKMSCSFVAQSGSRHLAVWTLETRTLLFYTNNTGVQPADSEQFWFWTIHVGPEPADVCMLHQDKDVPVLLRFSVFICGPLAWTSRCFQFLSRLQLHLHQSIKTETGEVDEFHCF